jgi:hypothetical protein
MNTVPVRVSPEFFKFLRQYQESLNHQARRALNMAGLRVTSSEATNHLLKNVIIPHVKMDEEVAFVVKWN